MPKLPRHDTKAAARRPRRGGVISGSTIVRNDRQRLRAADAPPRSAPAAACAARRAASGTPAARIATPSTSMMPPGRVERIAAAQRRCRAEQLSSGLDGPNSLQPRERHHLRRDQQRHHEAEHERSSAADVGQRDDQRERGADHHREHACRRAETTAVARRAPAAGLSSTPAITPSRTLPCGRQRFLRERGAIGTTASRTTSASSVTKRQLARHAGQRSRGTPDALPSAAEQIGKALHVRLVLLHELCDVDRHHVDLAPAGEARPAAHVLGAGI